MNQAATIEGTIERLRRLRALQARAKKLHGKTIEDMRVLSAEIAATPERLAHAPWRAIVITDSAGRILRRGYSRAPLGEPPRGFYEFQPSADDGGGGTLLMGLQTAGEAAVNLELGERALQVWCQLDTRSLRIGRFAAQFESAMRAAVEDESAPIESEGP